ncbi:uncharacterized protein ACRADG_011496 [Cochliomyia hominivorax]
MKFFLSFCLILTFATIILAKSMFWGKRHGNDRLLYRENVIIPPVFGEIQEVFVTYPRVGSRFAGKNVTAIYVLDKFTNSSGAVPRIGKARDITNRPRFNTTIVILTSQRSSGINSTVNFYGL